MTTRPLTVLLALAFTAPTLAPAARAAAADGPAPTTAAALPADDGYGRDLFGPPPGTLKATTPQPPEPKPPEPKPPAPGVGPLATDIADAFRAIRPDPPPKALTNDKHYFISNERYLDFWHDSFDARGGVYLGVGTDQNYILAGWCRPEVLIVMDFDQLVIDLQLVYWAFLREAKTPAEFVALWEPERETRKRARALLEARYGDEGERRKAVAIWRRTHKLVHKRLEAAQARFAEVDKPSFLDDQEQYDVVRSLVLNDRVFAVRGDLLAERTMKDIGDTARKHEMPVRVLYLSNTEMYFNYSRSFKPNILGLPFDEQTVVLRTLPVKPADYRYLVQPGKTFHAWLADARTKAVWGMYKLRKMQGEETRLYRIDAAPEDLYDRSKSRSRKKTR